ncbi:MAG: hypothetical protein HDT21_10735 [Ruminococcus sp.]|nr:hypothetical protein [Ruminococcus sp.]
MFAPPRNGSRRFSPPAPFRRICACGRGEGYFALLLKLTFGQLRPKAPPLDFASWAQLDQLMSAASPPKNTHNKFTAKLLLTAAMRAACFCRKNML